MKNFFASVLLGLGLLFGLPQFVLAQTVDLGGFDIREFHSDITIGADATVHVVEDLTIRFHEERHGIFRDIPVGYVTEQGNNLNVILQVVSVEADGRPATYETSTVAPSDRSGTDIRIKIGDADRYVRGDVRYRIAYDVQRALLYEGGAGGDSKGTDELYWNITGTAWPVIPRVVTATVHVPDGIREMDIEKSCYTGGYGSTLAQCEMSYVKDNGGIGVRFTANDFLTVAVRMPSGYITRPTWLQRMWWFVQDNAVVGFPVVLFFLLFAYWWREGRDPKPRSIVTEFSPPLGLSPAEIGVLEDGKLHDRELSATVVDLAVRGYLKIIEHEEKGVFGMNRSFTIERTGKDIESDDVKDHERYVVKMILGEAQSRNLNELQRRAAEVKSYRELVSHDLYQMMATQKWFVRNPETVRKWFFGIGITLVIVAFWIVMSLSVAWAVSMIVSGIIIGLFGMIMPKRTEQGTRVYEQVMGFKNYLAQAEKYRLEWQEKEGMFEKFLPYAMVFMVVDKWTTALADTVKEQAWLQSGRSGVWDAYVFNGMMRDLNKDLNSAVMVAPQSKASSGGSGIGGGFSGGGFGGGGGGSW